jgi:hypothetical protein
MARRSTIRSGTTKSLTYSVMCMVLGALLLVGGVMTWKDPAQCGDQTMQQGDTCEVTQDGSTNDNSMSQQESSNHREAIIMFVLGPLMVLGGAAWLSSEIRIRRRRGAPAGGNAVLAGAGPFPGPGQVPQYAQGQAAGQNPYAAQGGQQYGVPAQQQYAAPQQPQYGAPQAYPAPPQQQYGPPQPQQQQQPQPQQPQYGTPQPWGAPPQQGWPAQPQQSQQQPPQQGGWPGN